MDPFNYFKYVIKLIPKKYKWRSIVVFIKDSMPEQISFTYMDEKLNDLYNADASVVPHVKTDHKKVKLLLDPEYQKGEWCLVKKHNQKSASYVVHEVRDRENHTAAALFDELCSQESCAQTE